MRKLALTLAALLFAAGIALAADVPNVLDGNPYSATIFRAGNGAASAPAYSFTSATSSGFYVDTGSVGIWTQAGSPTIAFGSSLGIVAAADRGINWYSAVGGGTYTQQAGIDYDAANTLGVRNGTNGQTFRVYNTFTDASNNERGELVWSVNQFYLQTNQVGTGASRALQVRTTGAANLTIGSNLRAQIALTSTAPTCITNCGTSPSVAGSDSGFTVTMGASGVPASGWVVQFNGTFTNAPSCAVTMALGGMVVGKQALTAVTTTTTLTVVTNGTAPAVSDKYHVICLGV